LNLLVKNVDARSATCASPRELEDRQTLLAKKSRVVCNYQANDDTAGACVQLLQLKKLAGRQLHDCSDT